MMTTPSNAYGKIHGPLTDGGRKGLPPQRQDAESCGFLKERATWITHGD